ncbi:MAG: hypothetical protein N2C14_03895, partial [Planctomycetales bacterium]
PEPYTPTSSQQFPPCLNGWKMIIHTRTPARAGLIGNPSDGFFGVTIALTFDAFWAEVELWESPELEIRQAPRDAVLYESIDDLADSVERYGYYGGIRLIKAVIKGFADYCREQEIALAQKNCTIRYRSDIPIRVGLAGSSAIITSTLKALMRFYNVSAPLPIAANLVLHAETKELKIPAGLQDRVVQNYTGVVFMDFARKWMERGFGEYERLDPDRLPPLFIAYHDSAAEGTEVSHNDLRSRYERGEQLVLDTLQEIADCARRFREAMESDDPDRVDRMCELMNLNFDLRGRITNISSLNRRLIQAARDTGAAAKFCGSGGAIIGVCRDDATFDRLQAAYSSFGASVLRPRIVRLNGISDRADSP